MTKQVVNKMSRPSMKSETTNDQDESCGNNRMWPPSCYPPPTIFSSRPGEATTMLQDNLSRFLPVVRPRSSAADMSSCEHQNLYTVLSSNNTLLCRDCYASLNFSQRLNAMTVVEMSCQLCPIRNLQPEGFTKPFCDFMTSNPTVFHAVDAFKSQLRKVGFHEILSRDSWTGKVTPGGRYFVSRNASSLIAFTVGEGYQPGNGVAMVAGHIDAVTAKLKPHSKKPNRAGYMELGVAQYAGGLNTTWWDRDLCIGGRVVVRDPKENKVVTELVKIDWPVAKIPTLAPHFGVGIMGTNNAETEAVPVIGLEEAPSGDADEPIGKPGSFTANQPARLVKLIASKLGLSDPSHIVEWELELFDGQPATAMGMDKELISAGRIDDKLCSWAAMQALVHSEAKPKYAEENNSTIKLVALFDDEEIGSLLRQGARGNFLAITVERAVEALCAHQRERGAAAASGGLGSVPFSTTAAFGPGLMGQTFARSFLMSADVTHAVNPNFLGRYMDDHMPRLNTGMVLSCDSNGHMTTDAVSGAVVRRVAELAQQPAQVFQIRNDSRSGGTVGPMLSSALGVRAADVGIPQLSMHSIRATTGALDPGLGVRFFNSFFENWETIDKEWHQAQAL